MTVDQDRYNVTKSVTNAIFYNQGKVMSERSDKLRKAIGHVCVLNGGFDPNYRPMRRDVQKVAQAIVTDLGISREMVVAVIDALPDGDTTQFKQDEENLVKCATALSALLEVANG